MRRSLGAAVGVAILSGSLLFGATTGTPVLISADRACSVKVDGEDVAILSDDTPKKIFLVPGEHLFTAVAIDKATWKEVVSVGAVQKVVSITFGKAPAAAAPAVAPAAAAPTLSPAWREILAKPAIKARTGINEIARENSAWVVKAVEGDSPADKSGIKKGDVLLKADAETLSDKSYDQMLALDKGETGSTVTLEGLDKKGRPFKVAISRQVLSADFAPVTPVWPTTSLGSQGTCTGVATACSLRSAWNCGLGSGCFMLSGKCSGMASSCYGLAKFTCNLQPGCFFLGN